LPLVLRAALLITRFLFLEHFHFEFVANVEVNSPCDKLVARIYEQIHAEQINIFNVNLL